MRSLKRQWKIILVVAWLIFTVSFALWWMIFSLGLIERLELNLPAEMHRHRTMLFWEGASWMILLLVGGFMLLYFVLRERRQLEQFRRFVAAFSHDLKTSLTNLSLQAESLKEDLVGTPHAPLVDRWAAASVSLQLQMENSLYLAQDQVPRLFSENLSVRKTIETISHQWPQISFQVVDDGIVRADRRAFESVIKNLVQNSVVHGRASLIECRVARAGAEKLRLSLRDNGRGFSGDWRQLGRIFYRHNPSSGSGVGLYIVTQLLSQMSARAEFKPLPVQGFEVELLMEGSPL